MNNDNARREMTHQCIDSHAPGGDVRHMDASFEEFFKRIYIRKGLVSSKDELREAWDAALRAPKQVEAPIGYVRTDALRRMAEDDEITGVMVHADRPKDSIPVYASPQPAPQPVEGEEHCEGGSPECGPVEHWDSEGVPLCRTCWDSLPRVWAGTFRRTRSRLIWALAQRAS